MNSLILSGILTTMTIICVLITQNLLEAENEEIILEELRQESLSNGKIFDRYLIPYTMSPAKIEYFGGIEHANANYVHLNNLLENNIDNDHINGVNSRHMLLTNFGTLADTVVPITKISALVIQEKIKNGTYQPPDIEPLQILHDYLMTEYPDTGNSDEILTEMFGDMKILAPEVLDIVERKTLFGYFPSSEVTSKNMSYWLLLRDYGNCAFVEENDNCDKYLEIASNYKENNKVSLDMLDEQLPNDYSSISYHAEV